MHTTIRIEINGHHHEVHHHHLTGREVKALGHHEHGLLFRLDENGRSAIADDDDVLLIDNERFEIISNRPHAIITIEIDDKAYETELRRQTGAEIKALAKRPAGNKLFRLEGQQRVPVGDDESIELHDHDRFVTFPPHGHAS